MFLSLSDEQRQFVQTIRSLPHVLPREGAVHVAVGARPEVALRQVTDGLYKAALLVG